MSYNVNGDVYIFLRTTKCYKTGVMGRFRVIKAHYYRGYIDFFIPNFLKKQILGKHYYKPYGRVRK